MTLVLATAFLSSCGIYQKYERPADIRTDNLYGVEMTDTVSLGSLSWREFFTDPALQTLIEEGLENNTDLRVAELQITEAEAALKAMEAMIDEDAELVTLYYGEDVSQEDAQTLLEQAQERFPEVEIELQDGGQPVYYYLISVE